jgi:hypothetical protein
MSVDTIERFIKQSIKENIAWKRIRLLGGTNSSQINLFKPFNSAPCDQFINYFSNYACGCRIIEDCGLGLTPSGYYMCAIAGGIDRIFDLKVIPQENCSFVRFESDPLNFPVTGMSDVMP